MDLNTEDKLCSSVCYVYLYIYNFVNVQTFLSVINSFKVCYSVAYNFLFLIVLKIQKYI